MTDLWVCLPRITIPIQIISMRFFSSPELYPSGCLKSLLLSLKPVMLVLNMVAQCMISSFLNECPHSLSRRNNEELINNFVI